MLHKIAARHTSYSDPDIHTQTSVQYLVKNACSTTELCDALQKLGPQHQSDVRAALRENLDLQKVLHIDISPSHEGESMRTSGSMCGTSMPSPIPTIEIERSIWLLESLIADVHEHYPNANTRLQKRLVWHERMLSKPTQHHTELIQKEKALKQLATHLAKNSFANEHRVLAQHILTHSISEAEIARLPAPTRFNATMRQTLTGHMPKEIIDDLFPGQLEKEIKYQFRYLSHRSLHELIRPIDIDIEKSVAEINVGNTTAAKRWLYNSALSKINTILTQEDRAILHSAGILRHPTDNVMIMSPKLACIIKKIGAKSQVPHPFTSLERAVQHFLVIDHAFDQVTRLGTQIKSVSLASKISYHPGNNGKYPIRDERGNNIRMTQIASLSNEGKHHADGVKPFITTQKTEAERAALYDDYLLCRPFSKENQQHPNEKTLLGQNTVIAKKEIHKRQCLGVYGGTVKPTEALRDEDTYAMSITAKRDLAIDGDNILSRINTRLHYDQTGKACAHARTGYNVTFITFNTVLEREIKGQKNVMLPVVCATSDIKTGEELRIDYGYSTDLVKTMFA
ncbi:MAG: hypothetical protein IT497_03620 [Ottowia sp.]|nr:hypothetical protein [Ottowia sp.]